MFDASTVRVLAAIMAAGTVVGIVATIRWERGGGRRPRLRARITTSKLVRISWNVVQVVPSFYPFAVVAAPSLVYGSVLAFSLPLDSTFQVVGLLLWGCGAGLLLWCERLLGPIMTVDGVAEDHTLVTNGPFDRVRHPTYLGYVVLAFGTSMLFLSYLLFVFTLLTLVIANHLARSEERLLSSAQGFGEGYVAYMARTGRFLPKVRRR